MIAVTGTWSWFMLKGWARQNSFWKLALPVVIAFAIWEGVRRYFSEASVEISTREINIHRSWIFGGNRSYSSDEISGLGIGFKDEQKQTERYLCFTHKWHEVKFAMGISEEDANCVMEAVGELGAIGKESTSDPFGTDKKLTTLDLNSK